MHIEWGSINQKRYPNGCKIDIKWSQNSEQWSKNGPKRGLAHTKGASWRPRGSQGEAQGCPSGAKEPQESPRWGPTQPNEPQNGPKMRPRGAQDEAQTPQREAKRRPREPKMEAKEGAAAEAWTKSKSMEILKKTQAETWIWEWPWFGLRCVALHSSWFHGRHFKVKSGN